MPLFQPITTEQDLPPEGKGAETFIFDIKRNIRQPFDNFDLAKDVAAFANASGGVILVGAAEDRTRGNIGKYVPFPEPEAKRIRDAFNDAVLDRCSPQPLVNPLVLPRETGFVVAVNVWPFPGQAIGVLRERQPPAFAFPIRVGVGSDWLSSEQLPMLMVPELRRITILVDAIPIGSDLKITASNGGNLDFKVLGSRPLENVLMLELRHSTSGRMFKEKPQFNLPLDVIRSVWKDAVEGWRIVVQGNVAETGNGGAIYMPPRGP